MRSACSPPHWLGQSGGLTCLASEAECGQGQQGEHAGPHGVSLRWLWSAQTPVFPPASSTIYTLGPALEARVGCPITVGAGSRGLCQGYLGSSAPDL